MVGAVVVMAARWKGGSGGAGWVMLFSCDGIWFGGCSEGGGAGGGSKGGRQSR